ARSVLPRIPSGSMGPKPALAVGCSP
ncbi:hypothetical protein L195_g050697, partial [Trifolium pratense]